MIKSSNKLSLLDTSYSFMKYDNCLRFLNISNGQTAMIRRYTKPQYRHVFTDRTTKHTSHCIFSHSLNIFPLYQQSNDKGLHMTGLMSVSYTIFPNE